MNRREALRQLSLQSAAVWSALAASHRHDSDAAPAIPSHWQFFTPEQAAAVEAIAGQIIPTDDTPGAKEAGVIYFIDLNLAKFEPESRATYAAGLIEVEARCGKKRFADLRAAEQIQMLSEIEDTDFFNMVRTHTVMGFLSNPQYLGNRNKVGWKLIGFEDSFLWQPPFGEYEAAAKDPS